MSAHLKRRAFIALLGGAAASWPISARAQQAPKMLRVGTASPNPRTFVTQITFERRLRELGYIEGQNFAVEYVQIAGPNDAESARELVRRKVDVIVTSGGDVSLKAAMGATRSIPIVMIAINYDPVERGYVTSIARPTGNVTGLFFRRPELVEKQMEILAETFPQRKRLGILWDSISTDLFDAAERAAPALRLELRPLKLENPPYDFAGAFRSVAESGADMLHVLTSNYFNEHRSALAQLAIHHGLPTMFASNLYVEAGGLMSYGPSLLAMFRRAADYVDRLAKGARPADLPIEQPSKFDLVLNARTAKALGITLPPQLIARADEVIE
jgi:putative tryptophan/tyrosine transport system substrate-binding protein